MTLDPNNSIQDPESPTLKIILYFSGVVDVVSASDLTEDQNLWGISGVTDEEVFASKKVLYHGQVIAALICSGAYSINIFTNVISSHVSFVK